MHVVLYVPGLMMLSKYFEFHLRHNLLTIESPLSKADLRDLSMSILIGNLQNHRALNI